MGSFKAVQGYLSAEREWATGHILLKLDKGGLEEGIDHKTPEAKET